ncbi:MAG TPA: 2-oxoglutarate dehydrogenase, E2 component, dihydrolipoamide succinyltransferase [Terracidiphilus sp.]|nr:2-oxoglutarate dehydrogenase, E2 component, dihydrolipoamide succinyltransferase [Terracidiphilus sp.]
MPTDVIMPQMGESIFEGTITRWLKQPGESVEKDEPLFEISTDKVDAEIPSPIRGVLREIKFPEGSTVQVNTVVAVLDGGSAKSDRQKPSAPAPVQQPSRKSPPPEVPAQAAPRAAEAHGGVTEVVMPQMGESIFEGTITRWLKQVGDSVQIDEPLFEISTDKVDAEIPSHVNGTLTEIRAQEGETVQVNTVVAVIGGSASRSDEQKKVLPATQTRERREAQSAPPQVASQVTSQVVRSSPLVRRIAREHHIDLARVPGTGSFGRITKDDILQYINAPAPPQAAAQRQPPAPQLLKDELAPMTRMRAIIAERMAESKRTIPHAHTVYKVDMTRIARLRDRERAAFEQRHGFKLTYMPFIAAATIDALRRFPILNASLEESSIRYHGHIHLGIAVALEWGLIVPVVREAESRDFVALARAINDLAGRARAKKLMPDEVGGSTFTLTNPGVFGGEFGTPIINQPEAAILAIGGLRKEPVVLTDAEGNDTIAIRSVQYYCLGFDHRLIDGADSGKFMLELQRTLENWNRPIS